MVSAEQFGRLRWSALLLLAAVTALPLTQCGCAAGSTASSPTPPTPLPSISVTIAPQSATLFLGQTQSFAATVSGTSNAAVMWQVNGVPGGNSAVGQISAAGVYTAPGIMPAPASVTLRATSAADSTANASVIATIHDDISVIVTPSSATIPSSGTQLLTATLGLGDAQTFTASFCLASGASITWDVNGVPGGNSTIGTIVPAPGAPSTAVYTAPADLLFANAATIHATASAVTFGATSVSATVTLASHVAVNISPPSSSVPIAQRVALTAAVSGTPDAAVSWFVNGIVNGNATTGQICISGSNPCAAPTGPAADSIDFLAPSAVPTPNPVTISAVSHADASRSGSATATITSGAGPVSVSVSPPYSFLPPSAAQPDSQQFRATISGSANANVTWSVQPAVNGQGCSGSACGTITAGGLYTAPTAAPSPNGILVIATSQADPTKSASATVVITSGPTIQSIAPSSVMAGVAQSFPLSIRGINFVAGSGASASVILLNGVARATTCSTGALCTTALNPSDVGAAGAIVIEVQNPAPSSALSNPAPFVVASFDVSTGTISLSSLSPAATSEDIVVTEPTTAAASLPINVDFIGMFTGSMCGAQGSPLTIVRPTSGTAIARICVHGAGLDPTFSYTFTAPTGAPGGSDIPLTPSAVAGLFPNVIELDLQLASTTEPGVRSLFITTLNNDRAVASGMLEVK